MRLSALMTSAALFAAALPQAHAETAVFAGGCFWCVESDMDHVKGVLSTTSGYAGGTAANPTYQDHEGYAEAVKVEFDPKLTSFEKLTETFLHAIDVTDGEGQFCDRGSSYVPLIFAMTPLQRKAAEKAVAAAQAELGFAPTVPVRDFTTFTPAEDYHQDYYLGQNRVLTRFGYVKQADAYSDYRAGCGRDARVREVWGPLAYQGVDSH